MNDLTSEKLKNIENQIDEQKKSVAFDMREPTIELYVNKYLKDMIRMIMKFLFLIIKESLFGI